MGSLEALQKSSARTLSESGNHSWATLGLESVQRSVSHASSVLREHPKATTSEQSFGFRNNNKGVRDYHAQETLQFLKDTKVQKQ